MDVLARTDRATREADDLVVPPHRIADGDRARGDLVSRRHETHDGDVLVEQFRAADELLAGDDDVVCRMQPDRQR